MILRTWHGETHRADGDAYEAFVRDRAAPDYASVDGFLKLMFSRRDEGDVSHFLLVTVWRDEDAVASFALGRALARFICDANSLRSVAAGCRRLLNAWG